MREVRRAGLVGGLDDQRHIGRVLDLEVEAVVPTSGLFEDCEGWSSLRHLRQFCIGHRRLLFGRRLQRGKDDGGGLLDDFQALGQKRSVAVVQVDVVGGCGSGFSPTALPTTNAMASASVSLTTLVVVVRRSALCNISCASSWTSVENSSAFDWPGRMAILSAVAHAQRGGDVLGKDKLDALPLDERNKTVAVLAHVAVDLAHGGKLCAVGLRHIEDVGIAEANQNAGVLLGDVLLGFLVLSCA